MIIKFTKSNFLIVVLLSVFTISGCAKSKSIELFQRYVCPSGVDIDNSDSCKNKCEKTTDYYSVHPEYGQSSVLLLEHNENGYLDLLDGYIELIGHCKIADLNNLSCDYRYKLGNIKSIHEHLVVANNFMKYLYVEPGFKSLSCGVK